MVIMGGCNNQLFQNLKKPVIYYQASAAIYSANLFLMLCRKGMRD